MKKYICLLFILFQAFLYCQTISETWSDLYSRYEYRDSNGNLVGYKKYNTLNQAWEYTNLNQPKKNTNYVQPIDTDLVNHVLKSKQIRYDNNIYKVNEKMQSKINSIRNSDLNYEAKAQILKKLQNYFNLIYKSNLDYSSTNVTIDVLNKIDKAFYNILQEDIVYENDDDYYEDDNYNYSPPPKVQTEKNYKSGIQKVNSYSPILEKPESGAKEINKSETGEVFIIEKINDKFYKVKYKNTVGYMFVGWFK